MLHSKRHSRIFHILREEGTCTIADLARRLDVSLETIRRDIKPLTESGELVRMHGAVSVPYLMKEAPFERRMRKNAAAKKAIARRAASLIADGDSIMLDTGTTTSALARELLARRQLTVVTNSSDIARTLATVNGNTVYMAGGELRGDNGASFGASAIAFIRRFRVGHAFISIGAVDDRAGPMDYSLAEAEFAREVLACGEQGIMVTDSSKFGQTSLVRVCDFSEIDSIITDRPPPEPIARMLAEAGTGVHLAPEAGD